MTTITQITVFYVSRLFIIASPFLLSNHEVVVFGNDIQHDTNKGVQQIVIHRLIHCGVPQKDALSDKMVF